MIGRIRIFNLKNDVYYFRTIQSRAISSIGLPSSTIQVWWFWTMSSSEVYPSIRTPTPTLHITGVRVISCNRNQPIRSRSEMTSDMTSCRLLTSPRKLSTTICKRSASAWKKANWNYNRRQTCMWYIWYYAELMDDILKQIIISKFKHIA